MQKFAESTPIEILIVLLIMILGYYFFQLLLPHIKGNMNEKIDLILKGQEQTNDKLDILEKNQNDHVTKIKVHEVEMKYMKKELETIKEQIKK